jgi:hypothetical protein
LQPAAPFNFEMLMHTQHTTHTTHTKHPFFHLTSKAMIRAHLQCLSTLSLMLEDLGRMKVGTPCFFFAWHFTSQIVFLGQRAVAIAPVIYSFICQNKHTGRMWLCYRRTHLDTYHIVHTCGSGQACFILLSCQYRI